MTLQIQIPEEKVAEFCRKWKIKEFSIFGSALTDEFGPDSDVDVLVVFEEGAKRSLFDHMQAEEELEEIFGREVNMVEKKAIRNPYRRHHILNHHEVVYAS